MRKLFILLFITCGIVSKTNAQTTTQAATLPTVDLPGTRVHHIYSTIVQQDYKLEVMLPAAYSKSAKKYPVLYLQDAQWDFPLLCSLYGQQYFDGFIPEMIIVGITWGGINPNPDSLRARDYTPTNEKRLPQSGGAANYLSFLEKEAIPFIESNYRADNHDRLLAGCSLGGLFTLYALFSKPTLFQQYIAASPAVGWDNGILYQYEKTYFEKNANLPGRLYMTVGGVERGAAYFEKLAAFLQDRKYQSLHIKTLVLENTGHSGTKGEGYARGLQYAFERPMINMPASQLDKYVGHYIPDNGNGIELKNENNQLAVYFNPNNKYELYASSETDFYATSEFLNIHFFFENGKTTGIVIERYTGNQFFYTLEQILKNKIQ